MEYSDFEKYMENVVEHLNKTKKPGCYDYTDFIAIISKKVEYEKNYILDSPIEVEWEITSKCNLNCEYCYHFSIEDNKYRKDINLQQAFDVIEQLAENNVLAIRLEGGEPFIRKDIIDIITRIKEKGIGLYILSNGTLISKEIAQKLSRILNYNTDHIQISFDTLKDDQFNLITGTKQLRNKITNSLKNLDNFGIPIIISMVVTEKNINEIVPVYEFIKNFKSVKKFNVSPALSVGTYKGFSLSKELLLPHYNMLFKIYNEKGGPLLDVMLGHAFHLGFYKRYILEHQNEFEKHDKQYPKAGRSMLTIASDGSVYGEHNMTFHEMCMGNILEEKLSDIWSKDKWNIFRYGRNEQSECRKCDMKFFCSQRSIGIAYSKFKTIQAKDPNCIYKSQ